MLKQPLRWGVLAGALVLSTGLMACSRTSAPVVAQNLASAVGAQGFAGLSAAEMPSEDEPNWMGPNEDLGHFFQVDEALYRGQQPTDAGLKQLADRGIKTVIYLHYNKKQAAHEKQIVEGLGMRFVHIPMSWITPPKKAQIETWLKETNSAGAQLPAFVHCQHGRDRTGTMVGIYRIAKHKWSYKSAYTEMKEKGFRTFFVGLSWGVKRFANQHGGAEKPTAEELKFVNAPY